MKVNCIIVEDEPLALERLREYVRKLSFLNLLADFDNALDALAFIKSNRVDLIFLDINLGEMSGIQLLETSAVKSQVILTTAYQEYALKGFDLKVADYLLKPFPLERFVQAVDRAVQLLPKKTVTSMSSRFIFVKTGNRLEKIALREIILIEGMRDYRRIHTIDKKIMTLQTFTELERMIPPNIVCRVHRSYMVALAQIESIEKDCIKLKNQTVSLSETYKEYFFNVIKYPTR